MNMDKLTTKFQQALADAQSLAVGRDHQFIERIYSRLYWNSKAAVRATCWPRPTLTWED